MDGLLIAVVGAVSAIIGVLVTAYVGRRRERAETRQTTAEAKKTEQETEQSATAYWREQVQETIIQMKALESEVKLLKSAILAAQEKYERRVGSLHEQLDRLATELGRANTQLETANKTIAELREEVKMGNVVISQLQEKITKLLVDKAELKEG